MAYTATDLRKAIYQILDRILEDGVPVDIVRNGRMLRIIPVTTQTALERIKPIPKLIVGDPAALEHIDWSSEWKP